jgi:uncharacterized protein (DUF1501 family)
MKNEINDPRSSPSRFSRRSLLQGSATLAATGALARSARAAAGTTNKPVLVQVFLRGGMDGLTAVAPYGDGHLYSLRPTLAIRPPGTTNGALDLDGFFGLAPAAAPLLTPYNDGRLAIVHASGSTDTTRSHFEAFDLMEQGDPNTLPSHIRSGWGARYLIATAGASTAPVRGVGVGNNLPITLQQAPRTLPIRDFQFGFPGRLATRDERQTALLDAYATRGATLATSVIDVMAALNLGGIDYDGYVPENGAQYPSSGFGRRMREFAALIKGDIGVEIVSVNYDGWDLHASLGPFQGAMAQMLDDLTKSLEAFYVDMLGHVDDYLLVCLSEFGRHARENGSAGIDHGHGNAMFVMGDVNGGQVIANWPGLAPDALDQGDLAITIDYRDVLGELLVERLGVMDLAPIFPGHVLVPPGVVT